MYNAVRHILQHVSYCQFHVLSWCKQYNIRTRHRAKWFDFTNQLLFQTQRVRERDREKRREKERKERH